MSRWVVLSDHLCIGIDRKYGREKICKRNSVIQKHTLFNPFYKKVIVVVRDPRDVLVSFYFHEIYHQKNQKLKKRIKFQDSASDKINMVNYAKEKLIYPSRPSPGFSYIKFINSWLNNKNIHLVYYEELHKDAKKVLRDIIKYLGFEVIPKKIDQAVERHTFSNINWTRKRRRG